MVALGTFTGILKLLLILEFCNEMTTLMKYPVTCHNDAGSCCSSMFYLLYVMQNYIIMKWLRNGKQTIQPSLNVNVSVLAKLCNSLNLVLKYL